MNKEVTHSLHKARLLRMTALVGACIIMLISAVFCGRYLHLNSTLSGFPNTEIIYNDGSQLGFVNANGSGKASIPFLLPYVDLIGTWGVPLLTSDRMAVIVTSTPVPGRPGRIFVIPARGSAVDCGWNGIVQLMADGVHILVDTGVAIEKYLLSDCGSDNSPENVYSGVTGKLSPDEQYVAEVRETRGERGLEPYVVIRHLDTGDERNIGEGNYPVWSRDGQWLAYTGVDGIYLFERGTDVNPKLIVYLSSHQPDDDIPVFQEDRMDQYFSPIVSWSPDGQWLVYHVYSNNPVALDAKYSGKYYSIFKVNIETGETIKLLDGGYSPSWRWPVDEP